MIDKLKYGIFWCKKTFFSLLLLAIKIMLVLGVRHVEVPIFNQVLKVVKTWRSQQNKTFIIQETIQRQNRRNIYLNWKYRKPCVGETTWIVPTNQKIKQGCTHWMTQTLVFSWMSGKMYKSKKLISILFYQIQPRYSQDYITPKRK